MEGTVPAQKPSLGGHPILDLTNNDEVWLVP